MYVYYIATFLLHFWIQICILYMDLYVYVYVYIYRYVYIYIYNIYVCIYVLTSHPLVCNLIYRYVSYT